MIGHPIRAVVGVYVGAMGGARTATLVGRWLTRGWLRFLAVDYKPASQFLQSPFVHSRCDIVKAASRPYAGCRRGLGHVIPFTAVV